MKEERPNLPLNQCRLAPFEDITLMRAPRKTSVFGDGVDTNDIVLFLVVTTLMKQRTAIKTGLFAAEHHRRKIDSLGDPLVEHRLCSIGVRGGSGELRHDDDGGLLQPDAFGVLTRRGSLLSDALSGP